MIIQAIDAAGKDGTIRHVMSGVNPQGVSVSSFKVPTSEDMDHDFMWRYQKALPGRGMIGIFNRSYYEEMLVVRVHPSILEGQKLPPAKKDKGIWTRRFRQVNDWEAYLSDQGYTIVKLFLNLSKQEQRKRFLARIDEPDKNWKFSAADVKERAYWDDYQAAFSDVLSRSSTAVAPWYVIPADSKWFARIAAAGIIANALIEMDPRYPTVSDEARDGAPGRPCGPCRPRTRAAPSAREGRRRQEGRRQGRVPRRRAGSRRRSHLRRAPGVSRAGSPGGPEPLRRAARSGGPTPAGRGGRRPALRSGPGTGAPMRDPRRSIRAPAPDTAGPGPGDVSARPTGAPLHAGWGLGSAGCEVGGSLMSARHEPSASVRREPARLVSGASRARSIRRAGWARGAAHRGRGRSRRIAGAVGPPRAGTVDPRRIADAGPTRSPYIRARISVFFASNSSGEITPWSRSSASLTRLAAWSWALAAAGAGATGPARARRAQGRARAGSPPGPAA